jgi:hypothetical protein
MQSGVTEALRPLRPEAQRQVVLVTDGEIGFESEIVGLIMRQLPAGCRLHTVGVGPAVNRTLTAGAARAGRGAEIVVGLDEDPEPAIRRLVARLEAPVLTELALSGSALLDRALGRLPDVCAAAPVLVALRLRPEGGSLSVAGRLGGKMWEEQVRVPSVGPGTGNPAVPPLFGREQVEELEMRRAAGETGNLDSQIERTGLEFQIATRLTSWVAVSEEATVDPAEPTRRERIPQAVPQGLAMDGLGLHGPAMVVQRMAQSVFLSERMEDVESRSVWQRGARVPGPAWRRTLMDKLMRAAQPVVALHGRVVLRRDRQLVVEITLDGRLEWKASRVVLVWSGGKRSRATIDPRRTTRAGAFDAGQVIRLSLRLGKAAPETAPIRVLLDGGTMSIALSANP